VLDLVGSEDKTFREVPGGHMGVLAGRRARAEVWRPAARWLSERSEVLGERSGEG
jgi:polyhydroxyalkanoate synthase